MIRRRDFLKNTGSNLFIENKKLRVAFRGAWQILDTYGRLAQRTPAPTHTRLSFPVG